MPRKGASGSREWRLSALTHMEEYMANFLRRMSSPTKRYPKVEEAREEVAREKLLLSAELDGAPMIRRGKEC